jgi:hypothetical protein
VYQTRTMNSPAVQHTSSLRAQLLSGVAAPSVITAPGAPAHQGRGGAQMRELDRVARLGAPVRRTDVAPDLEPLNDDVNDDDPDKEMEPNDPTIDSARSKRVKATDDDEEEAADEDGETEGKSVRRAGEAPAEDQETEVIEAEDDTLDVFNEVEDEAGRGTLEEVEAAADMDPIPTNLSLATRAEDPEEEADDDDREEESANGTGKADGSTLLLPG